MLRKNLYICLGVALLCMAYAACKVPALVGKTENTTTPASYGKSQDTTNIANLPWQTYFNDPYLAALIDTALKNNQELNITLQEIQIARNEVRARKGEYLPFVNLGAGAGIEHTPKFTIGGASESNLQIVPGKDNPELMPDMVLAANAHWEIDIWNKLHNAKNAAVKRYLASAEGKNFVLTSLIAEVANSYYELLALDKQLEIVKQNIDIQTNALEIVKYQKEAARVTELAVKKFEAEVNKTKSLQYDIRQKITETENRINFLLARYPQPIARNDKAFDADMPKDIHPGIPSQLLANRPDIRQAEQQVAASKLDVKVAKAQFYPSVGISAAFGYQAFNPAYFIRTPESILASLAGELAAPLVNRNAIKATYYSANSKQIQAVYNYERTILNAYVEVANQLAKMNNLENSYALRSSQVQALTQSITIANDLFKSARADYMEVLLTQRDALEARFELVETKKQQLNALVNIYQALGGGWK